LQDTAPVALLERWAEAAAAAERGVLDVLLPDVVAHLHDLCGAIGCQSHRDGPAVADAERYWSDQAAMRLRAAGYGSLGIDLVLAGSQFEVSRAITGRRTRGEITAMISRGPAKAAEHLAVYGFAPAPLGESSN
jgi:hypothetical protein